MEKKKILIVDDEVDFTDLIKSILEQTGKYEVKVENNGSLAPNVTKTFKPDLILLDVMMPDMDGNEVARRVMNDESSRDIPIVFLTVLVEQSEEELRGGVIGGHPFIAKPVSAQKLIGYIEKYIGSRGKTQASSSKEIEC